MAPPTPLECSVVGGCGFKTAPLVPTWDLMVTLLNTHTPAVHGVPAPGQPTATTTRLEKLPRPVFNLNLTESQWSFTVIQWDNYISQSVVSPGVKLMQLQAACSKP